MKLYLSVGSVKQNKNDACKAGRQAGFLRLLNPVEAFARNPEEKAQMQSAFTELKTLLHQELARGKKAHTTV